MIDGSFYGVKQSYLLVSSGGVKNIQQFLTPSSLFGKYASESILPLSFALAKY